MKIEKIESEKLIERKLNESTKIHGGLSIKLAAIFMTGLPDRLILLPNGICFFVELKTTNEKARKIQIYIHSLINKLGFKVYIVDTVEGAKAVIQKHLESVK